MQGEHRLCLTLKFMGSGAPKWHPAALFAKARCACYLEGGRSWARGGAAPGHGLPNPPRCGPARPVTPPAPPPATMRIAAQRPA
ncbi:hypothetical protein E2C01_007919 [Portunus trituberculatus]|uniref:Uncharacterized protein n=1 Tax=Portunus trituberculatus TaxID=210409 RepID=A0A5B7CZE2_PORTR|nr:hypothetical protein [Portunus trituberculatus]